MGKSVFLVVLTCTLVCGWTHASPWHRYQLEPPEHAPFVYGVASGDPFANSILLWTYAKIPEGDSVIWSIWLPDTGSFENNVTSGEATVLGSNGHTVTVEATALGPDTVYHYAFEYQGNRSRRGRTRTAPDPQDTSFEELKVAVMSCSRVWNGFFNAYREVALRDDIHLVLHVGDWLYPDFEQPHCERVPQGLCRDDCRGYEIDVPDIEHAESCDELAEFRHNHQVLNTDIDVRAIRANHPMIIMPDNHDLDNSESVNLSANVPIRVWGEWVPNRATFNTDANGLVDFHRHIRYGSLFDLIVLDTRNVGEKEAPRSYLGVEQETWLNESVLPGSRNATWRLIATSQVFTPWTINNFDIVIATPFMLLIFAFFLPLLVCIRIRKKQWQVGKHEGNVKIGFHYVDSSDVSVEQSSKEKLDTAESTESKWRRCCGGCRTLCLSNGCMAFATVMFVGLLIGLPITLDMLNAMFPPDDVTGAHRLQDGPGGKAWDAHPASRSSLFRMLREHEVSQNNLFLTGDMHMALTTDVYDTMLGIVPLSEKPSTTTRYGVEFLPTGVTSPNVDEHVERRLGVNFFSDLVKPFAAFGFWWIFTNGNEHFRYFDTTQHGYGIVTVTSTAMTGEIRYYNKGIAGDPSVLGWKGRVQAGKNMWDR